MGVKNMSNSLIEVRYLSATDTEGSRFKAHHLESGKVIIMPYDHALTNQENQIQAFRTLLLEHPNRFKQYKGCKWVYGRGQDGLVSTAITDHNQVATE